MNKIISKQISNLRKNFSTRKSSGAGDREWGDTVPFFSLIFITFMRQGDVIRTISAQRNQKGPKDKEKDKLRKIKKY